jgi:hypothetical protein
MNSSQSVETSLKLAFSPTDHGIAGLTEQLLKVCAYADVTFERIGDICVCRWAEDSENHEIQAPWAPAAFRSILARIAALCNEHSPNSVTPYGGDGIVAVDGPPAMSMQVSFVNTADEQHLKLRRYATHTIRKENSVGSLAEVLAAVS